MSQTRNTGFLTNIIQYTPSGNISFVSGSTTLMSISSSGAITTTGVISGSTALSASNALSSSFSLTGTTAATASSVSNLNQNVVVTGSLTTTGQIVAQTLNVQQVTSSIVFSSGSNIFGSSVGNTQQMTGSVTVTGSFAVATTGTELQVNANGVNIGNALTDNHNLTGSLRISGSVTSQGGFILGNSQTISPTGSIGYNSAVGVYIYGKTGAEADFRLYNAGGLTAMSVVAGTQNVNFNGNVGIGASSPYVKLDVRGGGIGQTTTDFAVGSAGTIVYMRTGATTGNTTFGLIQVGNTGDNAGGNLVLNQFGGNVGIGTTGPSHRLTVAGNVGMSRFYSTVAFSSYTPDGLFNAASLYCAVTPPGSGELRFGYLDYGAGQYWGRIGFVAPTNWSLGTIGSAGNDFSIGTGYAGSQLYIYSNGNYAFSGSNVSDRRKKTNINYITSNQLDNILKLKPATFNKIADEVVSENVHTGFIAQDIMEEGIPNLVMGSDEGGYGLDYDGILALTVKAIQELKAENDSLKEILQRNNIQ